MVQREQRPVRPAPAQVVAAVNPPPVQRVGQPAVAAIPVENPVECCWSGRERC